MRVPIFVTVAVVRLRIIAEGLAALYQIPMAVLSAPGSGLKEKTAAALQEPLTQRLGFRLLRAFLPNSPVFSKKFITTYPNTGTALVTRHDDVIEVLDRNADFEVVYEPGCGQSREARISFLGCRTRRFTRAMSPICVLRYGVTTSP